MPAIDGNILWCAILTAGLGLMAYFLRKRDDKIDQHDLAIDLQVKAHAALELKIAENYVTKSTMTVLFNEVTSQNKEAIARVEKRIDETNSAIIKQGDKTDKVLESLGAFQTNVMQELSKKT